MEAKRGTVIAVLKDGRILESGTHNELMSRGDCYAGLVRRQQRGFIANDLVHSP